MGEAEGGLPIARWTLALRASGGRSVQLHLVAPSDASAETPLIIFSHGANAAPRRYDVLLDDWAAQGFIVAAPLHVDSEEHPDREQYDRAVGRAARIEDYALTDAALVAGQGLPGVAHRGPVIAAGHSYGALIAQVAGGTMLHGMQARSPVREPAAVIALSPPPPMPGLIDGAGWAKLRAPQLCVTGTADVMPGFVDDWRQHLTSHEATTHPLRRAIVFEGMDHYFNGAFGRLRPHQVGAAVATLNRAVGGFARACIAGKVLIGTPDPLFAG